MSAARLNVDFMLDLSVWPVERSLWAVLGVEPIPESDAYSYHPRTLRPIYERYLALRKLAFAANRSKQLEWIGHYPWADYRPLDFVEWVEGLKSIEPDPLWFDLIKKLKTSYSENGEVDDLASEITPPALPLTDAHDTDRGSLANEWQEAFKPLPLSGIARMFRLDKDETVNRATWQNFAEHASRNKLDKARQSVGSGKAESTFDPAAVGDWLVGRGSMDRAKVDRLLGNNLPPENKYIQDRIRP